MSKQRDLFGKAVRPRRPRYEASLERADRASLSVRAARVRWLSSVIPRRIGFALPLETAYVFEEAKSAYVSGYFVAAVILAAAFVEHWFSAKLAARGFEKAAAKGLAASIAAARANDIVNASLLTRVDRLRQIRNPFVHLKEFEHEYGLTQRMIKGRLTNPNQLLEQDAQEALVTMYETATCAFARG